MLDPVKRLEQCSLFCFSHSCYHLPCLRAGGHRQRASARRSAIATEEDSALGDYLLESWAFGELAASRVQKIAALAVKDHTGSPLLLRQLSELGTSGDNSQSCHRELEAFSKRRFKATPDLINFHMPMIYRQWKRLEDSKLAQPTTFVSPPFFFFLIVGCGSFPCSN